MCSQKPSAEASNPVVYRPEMEVVEIGEAKSIAALIETMHGVSETTVRNYGHAVRSSFAKSFGLLEGELTVLPSLPDHLAQGLFAKPASYPVTMRFSTAPGDLLPDSISTARGLALKVRNVEGERLPALDDPSGDEKVQDFIFVDAGFFFNSNLATTLGSLAMLGATTDKVEGLKKALSFVMKKVERAIEAVGMESSLVKHVGGQLPTHPLGDSYNTQAPMLYGPYIAKFKLVPVSPHQTALQQTEIELSNARPNALRDETVSYFGTWDAEWELRVQLCADEKKMPIEDASADWPEDLSPFVPVARIRAPKQVAWTEEKSQEIDDCMSFNPWHGLTAHRPLGAIMRGRREIYPTSARFRSAHNACPMHQMRRDPTSG